ncbi:MAG: DUF29 domain-containing protein [Candidatus Solibacter sp.]
MGATTKTLYDTDFAEWSIRTAELVRAGRLEEVDLAHLAEEIEDLGKSERKAVRSQLRRMLLHLIKQQIQPERDGASWRASVVDARQEIVDDLADSPSLRPYLETHLQDIYRQALTLAEIETGVPAKMPQQCPYTLDQLLNG